MTEILATIEIVKKAGYRILISQGSGESENTFITDLAVAVNASRIKTKSPAHSDRVAKYSRLLRIEKQLGQLSIYPFTIFQALGTN